MIWSINLTALLFAIALASFSQILLKHSSGTAKDSLILEYLNIEVITAYIMLLASTLLVIFAMQKIEYKNVFIMNSLTQVLVLLLGWRFFGEKLSIFKVAGMLMIVIGTIIFFV